MIQRKEPIKNNCTKCIHFRTTSYSGFWKCAKHEYVWMYRVALVTNCKDWQEKEKE